MNSKVKNISNKSLRIISIGQLNVSLHLHPQPINHLVSVDT